jgi:hypothetical protein
MNALKVSLISEQNTQDGIHLLHNKEKEHFGKPDLCQKNFLEHISCFSIAQKNIRFLLPFLAGFHPSSSRKLGYTGCLLYHSRHTKSSSVEPLGPSEYKHMYNLHHAMTWYRNCVCLLFPHSQTLKASIVARHGGTHLYFQLLRRQRQEVHGSRPTQAKM